MMTISMVTLIFLPPTAIATIFSMPFFNGPEDLPGKLFIHKDFWIYCVIAVPVTMITLGVYRWWRSRSLRAEKPLTAARKGACDGDDSQSKGSSVTAVAPSPADGNVKYRGKPGRWASDITSVTQNVWDRGGSFATRRQREPRSMV